MTRGSALLFAVLLSTASTASAGTIQGSVQFTDRPYSLAGAAASFGADVTLPVRYAMVRAYADVDDLVDQPVLEGFRS